MVPILIPVSSGVSSPLPIASMVVLRAVKRSSAFSILGRSMLTARPLRTGIRRSRSNRAACISPALAFSRTAVSTSAASSLSIWSSIRDALFRAPGGLPFGLPDRPFSNGLPRCFGAAFSATLITPIDLSPPRLRASAVAAPMPVAAPVTIAACPFTSISTPSSRPERLAETPCHQAVGFLGDVEHAGLQEEGVRRRLKALVFDADALLQ